MDPISLALITAIGAGVTSTLTDATKASLTAGYMALKTRVVEKLRGQHSKVPQALAELEAAPTSPARRNVLVEAVAATPLLRDPELVHQAQTLLEQINQHIPGASQIMMDVQNSAMSNTGTEMMNLINRCV